MMMSAAKVDGRASINSDRVTILHSDLNAFYASVEMMLDPSLRGKAVAVCGSTEDRHGIVLAKSDLAKRAGIKTGMVTWEAKRLCPNLVTCRPQYDQYLKYSALVREIYTRYTDKVEPYGMDECWLDVGCSTLLHGGGERVAEEIRRTVREELGLTVSIGVSFNKIFAKLGSDMKKPDAITVITQDDYRQKVWTLPAGEMIFVGRSTQKKLQTCNVLTIGDIARLDPELMQSWFGKNGMALWIFANGRDTSRVMHKEYEPPIKSIGHGTTATADLTDEEQVWRILLELAQDVGHRLRVHGFRARGVQLAMRDKELSWRQGQALLHIPTRSPLEITQKGFDLFRQHYPWHMPVRSLTIRAINLISEKQPQQLDLFDDTLKRDRRERLENTIDDIRRRFGERVIYPAALHGDIGLPGISGSEVHMPGLMYQ